MIKYNAFVNKKNWRKFAQFVVVCGGLIIALSAYSLSALPTRHDEQSEVPEIPALAPTPSSPTWAQVSLMVNSLPNVSQTSVLAVASTFKYTMTNTIIGVGSNFSSNIVITCVPTPIYQIYAGTLGNTNAVAATFTTTTPGTTCPLGTASCGTPANISLTLTTVNNAVSVVDTNYNKQFTSTNTGLDAYVTGYYTCTYTDPNLGTLVTMKIQWGQGQ